jgi:hypothetical protein
MREKIINIKAESFPWQAKFVGVLLLIGALNLITNYWWLSIILAVVGLTLLTGHSGTQIDFANKTFREYNSYLFIRRGVSKKYNQVESVFINKAKVSQQMYTAHTSSSSTFHSVVFNAYLEFDDGIKLFLTSRKDKAKLINFLNPLVSALSVDLLDNTLSR